MIQDIADCFQNTYREKKPEEGSLLMAFSENRIFLKNADGISFPIYSDFADWCETNEYPLPEMVYLFSIGETEYFLTSLPEDYRKEREAEGYAYIRMFEVRRLQPKEQIFAASTAWHLYVWYRDNRFCGRCGDKLLHDKKERMMRCPSCGNTVFPKIAPAVIVGVTDGDKILMTKYAGREYKQYALIAGFTEAGETAEETVAREVMEEVGLKVKNIRYYKSQPWGFDQNLLLGFFCEADGAKEIRLDENELSVAEWVDYRDIEEDREGLSLTREMMTTFRAMHEKEKKTIQHGL